MNPDTTWEYKAANGVINWGMPFVEVQGSRINQPPLGFYAQALFLTLIGNSIQTGVLLVTLFGLATTIMLYLIGSNLFNKKTALIATVLFGLSTWQLILTRSFLIDAQCLFWSLSCLYIGRIGIQRSSKKLIALSGILFALAFYTKLFAVFILVPLGLYYLHNRSKGIKITAFRVAIFLVPLLIATITWYTVNFYMMPSYLPKGLDYMFFHSDFADLNSSSISPSIWSVPTFLLNYGLGYLFSACLLYSLAVDLAFRRHLSKRIIDLDILFLASIISVLSVNILLGVFLNLKVPYTSTIKYAYQALPFFCLITASLMSKFGTIVKMADLKAQMRGRLLLWPFLGSILLLGTILTSIYSAYELSTSGFIIFRVELGQLLGYSFDNSNVLGLSNTLVYLQAVGFALVLFALFYEFSPDALGILRRKSMDKNPKAYN